VAASGEGAAAGKPVVGFLSLVKREAEEDWGKQNWR
jgi:hypothetical protein